MALTSGDRDLCTRDWVRQVHQELKHTARWNVADIRAAVDAVDAMLDLNASGLVQNQTVLQNMNAAIPEPMRTQATTPQKWLLLAMIALRRSGLLP